MSFTSDQQTAYNYLTAGYSVFLSGGGGVGKSYVIEEFIKYCDENNKNIVVCASTGIAALNIKGVTAHRTFKIPIGAILDKPKSIPTELKDIDVIILDEISMVRIDVFDYISQIILSINKRRIKEHKKIVQFIVVGDFFQLPPVITDTDRSVLEQYKYGNVLGKGFAFQSQYWKVFNFKNVILNQQMRQNNSEMINALNNVRIGNPNALAYFTRYSQPQEINDAIYLCGTNKAVQEKNETEFNKLKTPIKTYKSIITGTVSDSDKVVPDELKLRVGCRVMTMVNDSEDMYVNGSFGYATHLSDNEVTIKFDDGYTATIERYTWEIFGYEAKSDTKTGKTRPNKKVIGKYTQFPLKLAYAITIHKSQGQTYSKVNLNPYCWDCGQLYVALSRLKDINGLHLSSPIYNKYLVTSQEVKNFYRNI